jgi:tetratricopeptide (TPR) repeat protein
MSEKKQPRKRIAKLQPPDTFHVSAAIGWLELNNASEAAEEIARISPQFLDHPDVLEVRWAACAMLRSWEAALEIAEKLVARHPDRDSGWVHRAYALRRIKGGGLKAAADALRPAVEKFPKVSTIPFNLACYAAQLGRLDEAWEWLQKAIKAAGSVDTIKRNALADADLEPLWERVRTL